MMSMQVTKAITCLELCDHELDAERDHILGHRSPDSVTLILLWSEVPLHPYYISRNMAKW